MKRNLLYLFLLVGVAALAYYLVRFRGAGTLGRDERNFGITDTAAVARIDIADMEGHRLELVRDGSQWIMNGKHPARKDAMDMILKTMRTMAVRYPVPEATRKTVVKEMASRNRKVDLYDARGRLIRSFYIGNPPLDDVGNYMLIEGADRPYVVEVPSFHGSLETRFITDTAEMRSRTILSVPFSALKVMSVRYRETPDSSFVLDFSKSDAYTVTNPATNETWTKNQIDRDKLFAYVNFLKQVNCEAYEHNNADKPAVLQTRPFASVEVTLRDGTQRVVDCYYKPVNRRSKTQSDQEGNLVENDVDRFYGLVDGKDFVLLQYFHFGRLLKNADYFKA